MLKSPPSAALSFVFLRQIVSGIFLFGIFLLVTGCAGGGTTGTSSDDTITVRGVLRTSDGVPVVGASISIVNTDSAATTDDNGRFEIETGSDLSNVEVFVSASFFEAMTSLGDFDENTQTIDLELTVDQETGDLLLSSISVNALDEEPNSNPSNQEDDTVEDPISDEESQEEPEEVRVTVFRGTLVDQTGEPIFGATVSVMGRNSTDLTDASGVFFLEVRRIPGSATIVVQFENRQGSVRFGNIPDRNVEVELALILDLGIEGSPTPDGELPDLVIILDEVSISDF